MLRRIMRRAMRHAQLLGAREPLMHRLVWALVREMGQAYPDLVRAEKLIEETLRLEETRFRKTLERGLVDPRREERRPEEGRHVRRRHRVHAVRHLRLPARSDAGRAEVARHQRRSGVVHRRDGTAAREGAGVVVGLRRYRQRERLVPAARKARRHRISRLRHRERRRRGHRAGEGRQGCR